MALDSFSIERSTRSSPLFTSSSFVLADCDRFYDFLRLRPGKIDRQQAILQVRPEHFHAVRQHEAALELACGNTAVQVLAAFLVLLLAADDELVLLQRDIELLAGESADGKRDAQPFGIVGIARQPLD